MFDFDESGNNCRKRQRCWTQMVGLYFVSGGQWMIFFSSRTFFPQKVSSMEDQLWTSLIIYRPPQGHSLPTNKVSVTRRFVGFDSLTGSLHRLPFLLLDIEQSGWLTCAWTLFVASGRQISWNGRHLGMIFCIIGLERQWHSRSYMDWTLGLNNASNITRNWRCMLRICPRTGVSSECCIGIRLLHELGGTHAMIGLASVWHTRDFNSGASGMTLPRIRRCGCTSVMIL